MNDGLSMIERLEKTGSFLHAGVAYAISSGRNGLEFVTYAQLKAARKAKQAEHLKRIQSPDYNNERRAGFVWTFWTPGLGGFAYRGWWAYLRILGNNDFMMSERNLHGWDLILEAMKMFPCGVFPLPENFEQWKEAFAAYHARPGRFRKQGLAKVWATRDRTFGVYTLEKWEDTKEVDSCSDKGLA